MLYLEFHQHKYSQKTDSSDPVENHVNKIHTSDSDTKDELYKSP